MKLFHENPIFWTVKSKVIISLFEKVRLSVSISPRNLYNLLKSIKEFVFIVLILLFFLYFSYSSAVKTAAADNIYIWRNQEKRKKKKKKKEKQKKKKQSLFQRNTSHVFYKA